MASMFWDDINAELRDDPERARRFAMERARIAAHDAVVHELESVRSRQGVSKAFLARASGMNPAALRRLLTSKRANPQIESVAVAAAALGYKVALVPMDSDELRDIATPIRGSNLAPSIRPTGITGEVVAS